MAVTNRNSALYLKLHVNKYIGLSTDRLGRAVPIPFEHTIVSGETGGASAGVRDTVNLCVLPAKCKVMDLMLATNDVWASAGTNGTFQIGDVDDDDRYMLATELYSANSPIATEGQKYHGLAFAGQNYIPAADIIVLGEYRAANPVVGKIIRGVFLVILAE